MNLLTDGVYWWAAGLTLVGLGGGAWLTSRTPRTWRGVLINAVTILVASALVATSLGLVLNRSNGWYTSTDDLFPGDAQTTSQHYGATEPTAPVTVTRSDTRDLPALPAPGQRLQQVAISTSVGKQSWPVTILLPKEYFDESARDTAFPVLMAGHGYPGSMQQWSSTLDLRQFGDSLVAAGRIRPFITVIPSLTPGGHDTECIAGPDDARQLETWLSTDVPRWIKEHLRASPEPAAWAWIGFSFGGWCAAMMTMRYPQTFASGVVLDGYFQPWWPKSPPSGLTTADLKGLNLVELARTKPPAVSLWIQTSRKDPHYFPRNEAFFKAVKAPLSVTAVIDDKGGHSFATWRPHVQPALTWLGERGGFAP